MEPEALADFLRRRPASAWAVRQIAVYEKCVDAGFVLFCDLAFRLDEGLSPTNLVLAY